VHDTRQHEELPARLRRWLEQQLPELTSIEPMRGGAGARRYWRTRSRGGSSAVCMEARPEDPAILPPALRKQTGIPFLELTEWLAARGFPVPRLYAVAAEQRWILLEDLGSRHLVDLAPEQRILHYREALELLARLHSLPVTGKEVEGRRHELPYSREFDREWILFELGLFAERVPAGGRAELEAALARLADYVAALPRAVCLRDYQSHNLMVDARGALRILDYQDALLAAPELDLAALLHDSYVELAAQERESLLRHYEQARGRGVPRGALAALIVQRKCKDWSRFQRLVERGDLRFRGPDARAASSLREALAALPPELAGVAPVIAAAMRQLAP
jgi:aminoglycoside/choline kinase family phosphotransferase